ncbi:hypothetical protein E2542_SST26358 [Spatholobus suberectus]|nr:hypothetical protein E2542_SST26358 [Spatholobus suberectus]
MRKMVGPQRLTLLLVAPSVYISKRLGSAKLRQEVSLTRRKRKAQIKAREIMNQAPQCTSLEYHPFQVMDNVAYNQIGDPLYKAQSIGGSVSISIDNLLACHSF